MELTNKQKVLFFIVIIILILVGIYVYNIRFNAKVEDNIETEAINNTALVDNFLDTNENKKENSIIIHITGAVRKSGIVKLNQGARIYDAIEMAEGSLENADLAKVNLAYILEDAQKIYIPYIGEETENTEEQEYITYNFGNNSSIIQNTNKGESGKVNINTAKQTELETLPGIGTATAEKIIDYRNKNGKFNTIEDIQNVKGIGEAKYENIKESICVK
ncbi:MAG: helix-hairpin-helix domain-containing protein [Clostridia bacterium]|nr:helix-hairpin-helix domain-containing protein [Clostridia bacterium]